MSDLAVGGVVSDDYEVHVEADAPRCWTFRGPSPERGYSVYLSTCSISEGGGIGWSPDRAEVLAELDRMIEKLRDARRRLVELP